MDDFEDNYSKIGWAKGPLSSKDMKAIIRSFWRISGVCGSRWLARRIRNETNVDVLSAVANLLADMGHINPLLDELGSAPTPDQSETLLKAISWCRS